ncbi:MAG: hypothetical protein ACRDGM_09775 [bacterium]
MTNHRRGVFRAVLVWKPWMPREASQQIRRVDADADAIAVRLVPSADHVGRNLHALLVRERPRHWPTAAPVGGAPRSRDVVDEWIGRADRQHLAGADGQ